MDKKGSPPPQGKPTDIEAGVTPASTETDRAKALRSHNRKKVQAVEAAIDAEIARGSLKRPQK